MSGAAPVLLLSMPQMADPNFARTVVLLCDYTTKGAFGLVVNRQMAEPAWTMVKTEPPVERGSATCGCGSAGPVDPQQTWVLMAEAHGPDDEQREICPGVLLSVSHELTMQLLQTPPSSRARVVVGYAGWGPGQLDQELAASSWLTDRRRSGAHLQRARRRDVGDGASAGWARTRPRCRRAPASTDARVSRRPEALDDLDALRRLLVLAALAACVRAPAQRLRPSPQRRPPDRSHAAEDFRRWRRASRRWT